MAVTPRFLLALAYFGFISLGLPDSIIGVTWPSVYGYFGIMPGALGMLLTATVAGYLVSTLLAGRLLRDLGVGGLLAGSSALIVVSLAGFALAPSWGWFVGCGVIAGLGAGAIDSGLNAYAARHFSARHMNWLHACWGVGATLGAMAAASLLAEGVAWQWTYGTLAVVMTAMTLAFTLTRRSWQKGPSSSVEVHPGQAVESVTMGHAVRHPLVWAQVLVFFLYSGAEMTAATWAFTLMTQFREQSTAVAGLAVTLFWLALTAGRFLFGVIVNDARLHQLLSAAVTSALVGGLTFVMAPWSWLAMAGLTLFGASLAPLYPGLMTQTPHRLGRLADYAVGFQVGGAMLGQVTIPSLGGLVLQAYGPAWLNGMLGVAVLVLWMAIVGLFWGARLVRLNRVEAD